MGIKQQMRAELVDAMKSGDGPRRDVIRSVEAEVGRLRTAPGFSGSGEDDDFYQQVIGSYVKKMRKSAEEYAKLGERGEAMAAKLSYEVKYLSQWLPTRLDETESRQLVREVIGALGVAGQPKAQGRVMGHIMKSHRQEVDGGLVSRLVREELADPGESPG